MLDPERELVIVPPDREVELDFAVFAQMFREPLREVPRSAHDLLHLRGADTGWHDTMPTLYSFLALAHHERMSLRERKQLFVAMADDLCWDGEPISGMAAADRAAIEHP
jgi:hypothetical protein